MRPSPIPPVVSHSWSTSFTKQLIPPLLSSVFPSRPLCFRCRFDSPFFFPSRWFVVSTVFNYVLVPRWLYRKLYLSVFLSHFLSSPPNLMFILSLPLSSLEICLLFSPYFISLSYLIPSGIFYSLLGASGPTSYQTFAIYFRAQ